MTLTFFACLALISQVAALKEQGAAQAQALEVAEASAAQLLASQAEVDSLRAENDTQLQAAESAVSELRKAQAEVGNPSVCPLQRRLLKRCYAIRFIFPVDTVANMAPAVK